MYTDERSIYFFFHDFTRLDRFTRKGKKWTTQLLGKGCEHLGLPIQRQQTFHKDVNIYGYQDTVSKHEDVNI
jgi:hypothetical protein